MDLELSFPFLKTLDAVALVPHSWGKGREWSLLRRKVVGNIENAIYCK